MEKTGMSPFREKPPMWPFTCAYPIQKRKFLHCFLNHFWRIQGNWDTEPPSVKGNQAWNTGTMCVRLLGESIADDPVLWDSRWSWKTENLLIWGGAVGWVWRPKAVNLSQGYAHNSFPGNILHRTFHFLKIVPHKQLFPQNLSAIQDNFFLSVGHQEFIKRKDHRRETFPLSDSAASEVSTCRSIPAENERILEQFSPAGILCA